MKKYLIFPLFCLTLSLTGAPTAWGAESVSQPNKATNITFFKLQRQALNGDKTSQFQLCVEYRKKVLTPQNHANAWLWCKKYADQDFIPALVELSWIYFESHSLPWDEKLVLVDYYLSKIPKEQFYLNTKALILKSIILQNSDLPRSLEFLKMAADLGDALALKNLGEIYYEGQTGNYSGPLTPKNQQKAIELWKKSLKKGCAECGYLIARHITKGSNAVTEEAFEFLSRSLNISKNISPDAYGLAAEFLLKHYRQTNQELFKGYKSVSDAINWYKEGLRLTQEDVESNFRYPCNYCGTRLGEIYYTGIGIKKDLTQAKKYFLCSVELGDPQAKLFLAKLYLDDYFFFGDNGSLEKAREWIDSCMYHENLTQQALFLKENLERRIKEKQKKK